MAHSELELRDRRKIEEMLRAKVPVDEIAGALGRHRSTIYRNHPIGTACRISA